MSTVIGLRYTVYEYNCKRLHTYLARLPSPDCYCLETGHTLLALRLEVAHRLLQQTVSVRMI